jgi:indole-3-glycerol phosphate synthase
VQFSGLKLGADVARVAGSTADAALIGEALMREDDPEPLLKSLVASAASGVRP